MGIGLDCVQMYLNLWEQGFFNNIHSAACLGSQELHCSRAAFERVLRSYPISNYQPEKFINLSSWPTTPKCSAKHFFEMLGVTNYKSIDLNREHDSLPLDLNKPLENVTERFDLVTDHGTAEHVFYAPEVYRTMHKLCNPNGFIVIVQILYPFNINHGFYRFDPNFFKALAKANNYKMLWSAYLVTPKRTDCNYNMDNFHIPLDNDLLDIIDFSRISQVGEVFVMQKQGDAEFAIPYDVS